MIMQQWELDTLNRLTQMIARKDFNFADGYITDLFWDLQSMEKLPIDGNGFILVRPMGTSWCRTMEQVRTLNTPELIGKAIALIHVVRPEWNRFRFVELDPRDFVGEWSNPPAGDRKVANG